MIIVELLEAIVKLGLPVFGISWFLFHRLYQRGVVAPGAGRKQVKSDLKRFRKEWRGEPKDGYSLFENKWMRFGGGFYGITALVTFILIEAGEFFSFLGSPSAWLGLFDDGVISLIIEFLVGQLQNFITAFVWFAYWADGGSSVFIWLGVPYVSYLAGIGCASRSTKTDQPSESGSLEDIASPPEDMTSGTDIGLERKDQAS